MASKIKTFAQNKARWNFVNAEIDTKIAEWIVYLQNSYKNPFDRKSLATYGSSFQSFSKPSAYNQVLFHKTCRRINFPLRVFFTRFTSIHFAAIFDWILRLYIGSCFVFSKWVDGADIAVKKCHTDWKSLTLFLE